MWNSGTGQDLLSFLSLDWVDKMTTKLALELNTGATTCPGYMFMVHRCLWSRKKISGQWRPRSFTDYSTEEFSFYSNTKLTVWEYLFLNHYLFSLNNFLWIAFIWWCIVARKKLQHLFCSRRKDVILINWCKAAIRWSTVRAALADTDFRNRFFGGNRLFFQRMRSLFTVFCLLLAASSAHMSFRPVPD